MYNNEVFFDHWRGKYFTSSWMALYNEVVLKLISRSRHNRRMTSNVAKVGRRDESD